MAARVAFIMFISFPGSFSAYAQDEASVAGPSDPRESAEIEKAIQATRQKLEGMNRRAPKSGKSTCPSISDSSWQEDGRYDDPTSYPNKAALRKHFDKKAFPEVNAYPVNAEGPMMEPFLVVAVVHFIPLRKTMPGGVEDLGCREAASIAFYYIGDSQAPWLDFQGELAENALKELKPPKLGDAVPNLGQITAFVMAHETVLRDRLIEFRTLVKGKRYLWRNHRAVQDLYDETGFTSVDRYFFPRFSPMEIANSLGDTQR